MNNEEGEMFLHDFFLFLKNSLELSFIYVLNVHKYKKYLDSVYITFNVKLALFQSVLSSNV